MKNQFAQALATTNSQDPYETAVQPLLEYASQQPQDAKVRIWLGAACREAGDVNRARAEFREALRLAPDSATADLARAALARLENEPLSSTNHKDTASPDRTPNLGSLSLPPTSNPAIQIQLPNVTFSNPFRQKSSSPWWQQLPLRTKTTLLAIAFSTLPALGIGGTSYYLTNQAITQQAAQTEARPTTNLSELKAQLLLTLMIGTGSTVLLVGAIAAYLAHRATREIVTATDAVEKLGRGELSTYLQVDGEDELSALGTNINQLANQLQLQLNQQAAQVKQELLLNSISSSIREAFDTQDMFNTVVAEVRGALSTDRVVIYRFNEDWTGTMIAESVDRGWPPALGAQIADTCFRDRFVIPYQKGRVKATDDIYNAGLTDCHIRQLETFSVKANLVVPIIADRQLHGLLIAHQCSGARAWKETEIDFMKQVATQMGFALNQEILLKQQETLRKQQEAEAERARLLNEITSNIRESLDTDYIFNTAVVETRAALSADRVVVYRFKNGSTGTIVAESVVRGWPSALGTEITKPCFDRYVILYEKGRVKATEDIYKAELSDCHIRQLETFSIKANLTVPIIVDRQLHGLLIAHQCSGPRVWKDIEIDFFKQVAAQVGVALDQAMLLKRQESLRQQQEAEADRAKVLAGAAEKAAIEQRQQKEAEAKRAQAFAEMTKQILRSLNLKDIFNTTVRQVQQALKADRVVIYRFDTDWSGTMIAESVDAKWTVCLGAEVKDTCFQDTHGGLYRQGRVRAINNIYQANLTECHIQLLERFEVKANLVTPILIREQLLGLLIAHQCSGPRNWQQEEINWLAQVATQVGIAIEQATLIEQREQARQEAQASSQEQRQQKEALQHQLAELLSDVQGAAKGDLTVQAKLSTGEIGTVADFFNSIIASLRDIVTQVKQAAVQVNVSLGENEAAIHQLSEQALTQVEKTIRILESVEQMTGSIQAVAESARQAEIVARTASTTAQIGGQAMDRTVQGIMKLRGTVAETAKKVKRLGQSSQEISKVVSLINQVAVQTNLLALNAGIEAERAGEKGQGFAVVAEQVRELATRSTAATQEIERIVENIQRETSEVVEAMEVGTAQVVEGTHLVEETKHSLSQILEVSSQIDELVQSISSATVSQAQTSQAVTNLMQEIATVSEQTSLSSHQISDFLQRTVAVAQTLQTSVGVFKVDTENPSEDV
ncbi:MAG TPA: GAF domain-containing protein [Chroococcales cyanobacterium]|jgi:methyl-accepting chemotaxis protein PixJ